MSPRARANFVESQKQATGLGSKYADVRSWTGGSRVAKSLAREDFSPTYAARSRNSTFTASKGNSMRPSGARVSTPALRRAVASP